MPARHPTFRARHRLAHDWAWHEEQMAVGPFGLARDVWHVTTWAGLHDLAVGLMKAWLRLPLGERLRYAYPNPEDRRVNGRRRLSVQDQR